MLQKLMQAVFGAPTQPETQIMAHESGQMAILSTQELERRRFYERMAQHQRLIEVEEDLRRRQ